MFKITCQCFNCLIADKAAEAKALAAQLNLVLFPFDQFTGLLHPFPPYTVIGIIPFRKFWLIKNLMITSNRHPAKQERLA